MTSTRGRIQRSSLTLFADKGYEGVTTKEIALAAEISEVTLFRHFRSKRELFESIASEMLVRPTLQYMAPQSFTGQWHTDITRFRGLIYQFQSENCDLLRMLIKDSKRPSGELKEIVEFNSLLILYLKEYLIQHWELTDMELALKLADSFIAALSGLAFNHSIIKNAPGGTYRESTDLLIQSFFTYKLEMEKL